MNRFRRLIHEAHRRSLWQVLGIYAVSSWVVYQVVLGFYEGIGLPDWVPATAVVLLLVGLPIVLATAFVQEGATGPAPDPAAAADPAGHSDPAAESAADPAAAADSAARSDSTPSGAPSGPAGAGRRGGAWFTWRRSITGGVLAFAVLGLAATGFMGMRTLGIGPAATLVSSGVLEAREPILLAEFGSASGDSVLASAVTAALRVDLESSPMVSLVPAAAVQEGLRRMLRDPASPLTEPVAAELALREGIRAVLAGDVTAAGGQYVLTARLVTPDGQALASVRQTASSETVIEAADRLSAQLRERLGESFKSIRASEPLAQVTTGSLEALRKYSQGLRAFDAESDADKAIGLLREAVGLDSAFAMAWRKLGVAYQFVDPDSLRAAIEQAFRHRARLTDRERYLTEGTYYDVVESDTARAVLAYETLLDLHPDEHTALHNLARLRSMMGDYEGAAALYERALAVHPYSAGSIRNQVGTLARLRRYDAADSLLDLYGERYPDHYQGPQYRAALAAMRYDYDGALEHFEEAYRASDGDIGLWGRISLRLVRGQIEAAIRDLAETVEEDELRAAYTTYGDLIVTAIHRGEPVRAADQLEAEFTPARLAEQPVESRPYYELTLANLLAGRADRAETWLERWRADRPGEFDPAVEPVTAAMLELEAARGDPSGALRHYRQRAETGCLDCWFQLGRIYDGAGMPDSALIAYETYIDPPQPPLFRVNTDQWWLPAAILRSAELQEDAGNAEAAARHYAWIVEHWADADPPLQPRVQSARSALARLTRETP